MFKFRRVGKSLDDLSRNVAVDFAHLRGKIEALQRRADEADRKIVACVADLDALAKAGLVLANVLSIRDRLGRFMRRGKKSLGKKDLRSGRK